MFCASTKIHFVNVVETFVPTETDSLVVPVHGTAFAPGSAISTVASPADLDVFAVDVTGSLRWLQCRGATRADVMRSCLVVGLLILLSGQRPFESKKTQPRRSHSRWSIIHCLIQTANWAGHGREASQYGHWRPRVVQ